MRNLTLVLVLIFIMLIPGMFAELHAQITFTLSVQSATNTQINAELSLFNPTNITWAMQFDCDPFCGLALNGDIQEWGFWTIITPILVMPGETVNFPIVCEGDFVNGLYNIQAVLLSNGQYMLVGNIVSTYIGSSNAEDMDWELLVDYASTERIDMRLLVTNNTDFPWNHTFSSTPFTRYSIDAEIFEPACLPVITEINLLPGESQYYPMQHSEALAEGTHTLQAYLDVFTPPQYLAVGEALDVLIERIDSFTIGAGDQMERIPVDFYWRNSLYQCIFTREELEDMSGWLRHITFYSNLAQCALPDTGIKVYLGATTQEDLSNGWIPATEMTLVYDGFADFMLGEWQVELDLDPFFLLPEDQNLVMMVNRTWHLSYWVAAETFFSQNCATFNARRHSSDAYVMDPMNPPSPTEQELVAKTPKTSFLFTPLPTFTNDPSLQAVIFPNLKAYPNPCNPQTTISYELAKATTAEISIYNLKGQQLISLKNEYHTPGQYKVPWNGCDKDGKKLSSGVYFYRLSTTDISTTKKVVLLH